MIVSTDLHVYIELTSWEASLLRDLLQKAADAPEKLSISQERLRVDLLSSLPGNT